MSIDITSLSIVVKSDGIREASNALGGLSTSAANTERRIAKLIETTEKFNKANMASALAMDAFTNKFKEQKVLMDSFHTSSMGAAASTKELATAMALLAASLNNLDIQQKKATVSQKTHSEGMKEAHALARGLSGSLGALWMTYGNLAGMAVGVGIGATLKSVVSIGADVEHTLTGIQVRGEQTTASMNKVRESLFDLSKGVYGPQEVANAFNTLVMAGLNARQAVNSIGAALNLATAGGTSIEKSAETLVSVGSSIGYAAEGFSRIGDVIAKTAALSMSSVETLSEAFKSASSVSKLYGVSLEDIATSLGVLSNLGIQGSAAGTALKNMYKELASEADKVQGTMKKMGMTPLSLRDKDGNFRSLIDMVTELDKGLKTLSSTEEKNAIARLTNERGMRLLVQALDVYRQKIGENSNALKEFRDGVENSYAFAALASVQMALTVKSQMTSMMNTLKTTFAQTFKDIEPEVSLFTQRMKAAFDSPEFKNGIVMIAESFARLSLLIAENIGTITQLIGVFIALKAAMMITALLSSVAVGFGAVTTAIAALRAGTFALSTVFPPLRLAIIAVTAAMIAYNWAKGGDEAKRSAEVAAAYSKDIIEGMKKEAKQLEETTKLLKQKMSLEEASAEIDRRSAYTKMVAQDQKALNEAREKASRSEFRNYSEHVKHKAEVVRLEKQALQHINEYNAAYNTLAGNAKKQKEQLDINSKDKPKRPDPTNSLTGDPSKSEINDAYTTAMLEQQNKIRDAMRDLSRFEETENLKHKAGQISKLEVLENVAKKQIETYARVQAALKEQMGVAKGPDKERVSGAMEQATDEFNSKKANTQLQIEAANVKAVRESVRLQIVELEKKGEFALAAEKRWSEANSEAFAEVKRNHEVFGGIHTDLYNQMKATQKEAIREGFNREAVRDFNTEVEAVRNALKSVQTSTEGQGLGAMFEAATAASGMYADKMADIRAEMSKMTDNKSIVEAQANLNNLAENQRKMWVGVGESISNSLKSAFGEAGQAAGDLLMIAVKTSQTQTQLSEQKNEAIAKNTSAMKEFGFSEYDITQRNGKISLDFAAKERSTRIKAYGDAAGAAKGFFKEGTTGYKVMEGAEKAFRLVEMVGMAKALAMHIANAAAAAYAWVAPVFMSFMAYLGPWGMAAAGVAIAAVLGGAFGGGSGGGGAGRKEATGKGSVLGDSDAKSESIASSLSVLEKNSGLGIVQNNAMLVHMKTVADGISSLTNMIVRASGVNGNFGVVENSPSFFKTLFGSSKTKITDQGIATGARSLGHVQDAGIEGNTFADVEKSKWWGASKKTSTITGDLSEDVENQFKLIITGMADSISSAATLLGIGGSGFTEKLKHFVVDIGAISTKGLTGVEIEEKLQAIFSKLGDDMAKFGIAGMEKHQKVGEGYLETLSRVANNLVQVKDVFAVMGQSLTSVGLSAVDVSEGLISAAGGLDKLTSGTKYFVDNFLTEAERMAPITASVTARLEELGVSELKTVELYKSKVMALNLANAEDQKLYAALIELAPAFKEVSEYANGTKNALDIVKKQRELDIRLMEATGNKLDATNARRHDELAALAKLDPALAKTQQAIYNAEDASDALTKAKSVLEEAYRRESAALQTVVDKFKKFSESLKKLKDELTLGELSTLTPEQKYAKLKADFESVSALAKTGDAQALENLPNVAKNFLEASRGYYASTEDYARDFRDVQDSLSISADAADKQVSIAQSQLDVMNKQAATLIDIKKEVISFAQALKDVFAAKSAAVGAGVNVSGGIGSAHTGLLADVQAYGNKNGMDAYYLNSTNDYTAKMLGNNGGAFKGEMDYWANVQAQFDAGMVPKANGSVSSSISGDNKSLVESLYQSELGRTSDAAGLSYWAAKLEQGTATIDQIKAAISSSQEAVDGSHYNGLDKVPFDGYTARMHKGERIQTAKAANDSDKNSAALVELTKELIIKVDEMKADTSASVSQRSAIAEQTAEQMDMLVRTMENVKRAVVKTA